MEDKFKQSIKEMATDELLNIVGSPEKWQPIAIQFANNELIFRNIEQKKIETAKYLSKKKERIKKQTKANQGYHLCDFISQPFWTLVEITFSWELEKDGFPKKARQQKKFRIALGIIILIIFILTNLD
jgi:predicted DNA-binding protein (MmcQ/YjbR family)